MESGVELTAETLWSDVASRLRETLNDTTFQTWFGGVTGAELDGDTFVVSVPNDFTREWIEGHFLDLLRSGARDAGGRSLRIQLRVDRAEPVSAGPADPARCPTRCRCRWSAFRAARRSGSTRSTRSTRS